MFSEITLSFRLIHNEFWKKTPVHTSDYSFTNLYAWSEGHKLSYAVDDGLLWLKKSNFENTFWAPLGDWEACCWQRIIDRLGSGARMLRVPQRLIDILQNEVPGKFKVLETPEEWDYLYLQKALATLSGSKLHKKKNHWNAFVKTYGEDFRVLGEDDVDSVRKFEDKWFEQRTDKDNPDISRENAAVHKVLDAFDQIGGLKLGGLFYQNEMIAFSLGEALDEKTLLVHFEKALPEYRGVYQAINLAFAREFGKGFEYINREQDSGSSGLRQAKQSYYPVAYGVKNTVCVL